MEFAWGKVVKRARASDSDPASLPALNLCPEAVGIRMQMRSLAEAVDLLLNIPTLLKL